GTLLFGLQDKHNILITAKLLAIFAIMNLSILSAISPVDGRYRNQLADLAPYFSEFGLIRYRLLVEVEYFIALAEEGLFRLPASLTPDKLRSIYRDFTEDEAMEVKATERVTNHDVKAVEY